MFNCITEELKKKLSKEIIEIAEGIYETVSQFLQLVSFIFNQNLGIWKKILHGLFEKKFRKTPQRNYKRNSERH